jgi:hypothetical protein
MVYNAHARVDRHDGQESSRMVSATQTQPLQAEDSKWRVQVGSCGIRHGEEVSTRQPGGSAGDPRRKTVMYVAHVALFWRLGRYPRTYISLVGSRSVYVVFLMSFHCTNSSYVFNCRANNASSGPPRRRDSYAMMLSDGYTRRCIHQPGHLQLDHSLTLFTNHHE